MTRCHSKAPVGDARTLLRKMGLTAWKIENVEIQLTLFSELWKLLCQGDL